VGEAIWGGMGGTNVGGKGKLSWRKKTNRKKVGAIRRGREWGGNYSFLQKVPECPKKRLGTT